MKLLLIIILSLISVACFSQRQVKDTSINDTLFLEPLKYKVIVLRHKAYKIGFDSIKPLFNDCGNGKLIADPEWCADCDKLKLSHL